MAAQFTCPECHEPLKSTTVGKQVECDVCGAVVTVGTNTAATKTAPPAVKTEQPAARPASGGPEAEAAEKTRPETVSDRRSEERSSRRSAPAARRRYDDDDDDDVPRPQRRRSGASYNTCIILSMVVGGGGLLVLIAGGAILAMVIRAARRPASPPAAVAPNQPGPQQPQPQPPQPPPTIAGHEWLKFTAPDGRCHVDMPGRPLQVALPQPKQDRVHFALDHFATRMTFAVTYYDLPVLTGTADQMARAERDAHLTALGGGRSVSERGMKMGVFPGLETQIEDNNKNVYTQRFYVVQSGGTNRVYQFMAGGPGNDPNRDAANRFLNSAVVVTVKGGPVANLVIPEGEWSVSRPADGACVFTMPGRPEMSREGDTTRYQLKREKEGMRFEVNYSEHAVANQAQAWKLYNDEAIKLRDCLKMEMRGTNWRERAVPRPVAYREAHIRGAGNESCVMRVYFRRINNKTRIYRLIVTGPNLSPDRGDAAKFVRSFQHDTKTKF
jgi:hypothetical protein